MADMTSHQSSRSGSAKRRPTKNGRARDRTSTSWSTSTGVSATLRTGFSSARTRASTVASSARNGCSLELRLSGAASRGNSLDTTEKEYTMPLSTQVRRNGEPLKLAWGGFHVACMVVAAAADSGQGPYEDNSWNGITGSDLDDAVVVTHRDVFSLENYGVIATTPLNDG